MSLEQDVRGMAGTRPFSLMPREALQLLAFSCERRSYRPGDILFSAGEAADCAYFLLSGEVELSANGAQRTVRRGALLGESALASELTRLSQARAVTAATALRVPREIFRRVLTEFPDVAAKMRESAAQRTRQLLDRLEDVSARAFKT